MDHYLILRVAGAGAAVLTGLVVRAVWRHIARRNRR